jgi:putative secretion ATPase (PEP-CTERM system associated)
MYTNFYKLQDRPFKLTPDHRFFFDSQPHRKALSYLTYGLHQGEGFVVITGEVGAGKTILVEYLLSKLESAHFAAGKVVTTQIHADDVLRLAALAFGLAPNGADKASLLEMFRSFLISSHRNGVRPLLIVDEAQNLSHDALEELRMMSNIQLRETALLQIHLVGQPEFRTMIASDSLEQLRQRVIASYHLRPLDEADTRGYIEHRLRRVGWQDDPNFTAEAFARIYEESAGVPRRINLLCDRVLLCGFLEERHEIDRPVVDQVIADMRGESLPGLATEEAEAETSLPPPETTVSPSGHVLPEADAMLTRLEEMERRFGSMEDKLNRVLDELARRSRES